MALDIAVVAATGIKIILIITCAVVLNLLDPAYAFISAESGVQGSWMVIFTYFTCAVTLVYIVVSILIHAFTVFRCSGEMGTCALFETIFGTAAVISWLLIAGLAGSISWRSGEDTSTQFGWISALSALNVLLFILIIGIFCGLVGMRKWAKA